jgi:hypothetical protein
VSLAQRFAQVFGAVYLLVGILEIHTAARPGGDSRVVRPL